MAGGVSANNANYLVNESYPVSTTAWTVGVSVSGTVTITVHAYCL